MLVFVSGVLTQMKVIYGKEKHFLVEVEDDGAGELEEHHLPGHQDYVEEGKITQQRHSIDKKSKRTELGGGPTRPQLDSRPKKKTDVKCGSTSSDCEYVEFEDMPGLNVRKPDKKEIKEIIKRILEDRRKTELGGGPQLDSRPKKITDVKCGSPSSDCEYDEINITIPEEIRNIIENKRKSGATNLGSDPQRHPTRSPTSAPSSTKLGKKGGNGQREIQYANPEHLVGIIERKPVKDSGKKGSNGLREIQKPKQKDLKDFQ